MKPLIVKWNLKGDAARTLTAVFAFGISLGFLFIGGDLALESLSWSNFGEVFAQSLGASQIAFGLLNSAELKFPAWMLPSG